MKMNKKFWAGLIATVCVATLGITAYAAADNAPVGSSGTGYVNVPSRTRASASTVANARGSGADYVEVGFNAYTWGGSIYTPEDTNSSATYANSSESFQTVMNSGTSTTADCFLNDGMSIEYVNSYHAIKRGNVFHSTVIEGTESAS